MSRTISASQVRYLGFEGYCDGEAELIAHSLDDFFLLTGLSEPNPNSKNEERIGHIEKRMCSRLRTAK